MVTDWRSVALITITAMALGGCKTSSVPQMPAGFDVTRADVGEAVRVCGYKKGSLLHSTKDDDSFAFKLTDFDVLTQEEKGYRCALGELVWLGCASEPSASCAGSGQDFGLDVEVRTY